MIPDRLSYKEKSVKTHDNRVPNRTSRMNENTLRVLELYHEAGRRCWEKCWQIHPNILQQMKTVVPISITTTASVNRNINKIHKTKMTLLKW